MWFGVGLLILIIRLVILLSVVGSWGCGLRILICLLLRLRLSKRFRWIGRICRYFFNCEFVFRFEG